MVPMVTEGVICPPDMLAAQYTAKQDKGEGE